MSTTDRDSVYESEDDEFAEFNWLEQMDGQIKFTSPADSSTKQIGYCNGKLIRRDRIHSFYDDMEEPTPETSQVAFDLFDRYGRLRKEFKEHSIKKGSGIWGDELDQGDLLLFEHLIVEKPYRRRGLGRKVVNAMLEKTHQKSDHFFAIVSPGYLTREVEKETRGLTSEEVKEIEEREGRAARDFWRSLGFRRIGSSRWFAIASDKGHQCHSLSALNDFDPPLPPNRKAYPDVEPLLKDMATIEDPKWDGKIKEMFQSLSASDSHWWATDDEGNTVLHVAAKNSKPQSVEWILSQNSQLLNCLNNEGETPLEALEFHLESGRTKRGTNYMTKIDHISDKFKGFSDKSVMCLIKLKGIADASPAEVLRLTYGCTCGQCIAGFLSRRMRFALQCQAELQYDMLNFDLEGGNGKDFVACNGDQLRFVPNSVRENLKTNKSMREGFTELCLHFATCIKKDNIHGLPIQEHILLALQEATEWPPVSRNFLQRGGTIFSVASMIFEAAMNQDRFAGDGEHFENLHKQILQLPECRNDHEFGFVSAMCGYKRVGSIRYISVWTGEEIESD